MAHTTDSTLTVRGAELAYTEAGPGGSAPGADADTAPGTAGPAAGRHAGPPSDEALPLVVNAHGLTSSRASAIATTIGDYRAVGESGRRRLLSYDARGHGESDAGTGVPRPEDFAWSQLALDLLAIADSFSPDAPVSGIGLSMGTGTLLHAVTHLPGRFDRLVLSAPPTAWETRAAQVGIYQQMAEAVEQFSDPEEAAAALQAMLESAPVPPVFADAPGWPPAPAVPLGLLPTVFRGAALSDLPSFEQLAEIRQPTLILAWAGDPGHPVSTAEKLAELIPGAELVVSSTTAEVQGWGARAAAFLD